MFKKALLLLVIAIPVMLPVQAFADGGWVKRSDHYVWWEVSVDRPSSTDNLHLWDEYVALRSEAIHKAIQANIKYEKHLAYLAYLAAHPPVVSSSSGGGGGGISDGSVSQVIGLIHKYFYSYEWGKAECIAWRESLMGQDETNNMGSSAGGIFQWLAAYWPGVASAAGWGGYSRYHDEANVASSAHYVHTHGSWSPWASSQNPC